jgi:EmrB/QacA subfamily drug resistance transporter
MDIRGRIACPPADRLPPGRRAAALAVLCVSLLVVSLDNTILNIALPALVLQLHATTTQLQWIVDAYAVVFGGLLLVAGSLGDRIGRKRVFLAGLLGFGAGSAGSAFATRVDTLVVSRAVMGLGAAAIMPATLSIIMDLYRTDRERARAIGLWSATSGLGIAVGPIAGGWLLARYWWGSVFFVNVPFVVLGAAAALVLVPESREQARRRVDLTGAAASVIGLSGLLWAVIEIPQRDWHSPLVVASGTGALAVLGLFVLWERRTSHPMLVLEPFGDRRFSMSVTAVAFAVFVLMGAMFLLTQYLQFALGYSPMAAGLRILPVAGVLAAGAPASTVLDRWFGTKAVVAVALACLAGGLWLLSGTTVGDGFGRALPGLLVLGLGAGTAIAPATAAMAAALPRDRAGVGSATNGAALQVGGALGVAVLGSVLAGRYQGRMTPLLAGRPVPPAAREAVVGSLGGALEVARQAGGSMGAQLAAVARAAFVEGMTLAMAVGACVMAGAVVLVLLMLPSRTGTDRRPRPPVEQGGPDMAKQGHGEAGLTSEKPPGLDTSPSRAPAAQGAAHIAPQNARCGQATPSSSAAVSTSGGKALEEAPQTALPADPVG